MTVAPFSFTYLAASTVSLVSPDLDAMNTMVLSVRWLLPVVSSSADTWDCTFSPEVAEII